MTPASMLRLTPTTADRALDKAWMTRDQYEAFAHLWRTSVRRHGPQWQQFEKTPTRPEVIAIVAELRAEIARQAREDGLT